MTSTKPLSSLGLSFPLWKGKGLNEVLSGTPQALMCQDLQNLGEHSDNIGFVHFGFILLAFK